MIGKFTIGKLAKKADVNVETIRYYEDLEILPQPDKNDSGYREYTGKHVGLIRFIKQAKKLGFTLKEIKDLIYLKNHPELTCVNMKNKIDKKLKEIDEEIGSLQEVKKTLSELSSICPGSAPLSECPILGALENEKS